MNKPEDGLLLDVRDLKKHYPVRGGLLGTRQGLVRAVDGVNLTLHAGETVGLVGESGCGKSTLARLILGLEQPTSGDILLKDRPLADWDRKELRRTVQMIFQDPYSSLNPRWKVGSIVREPLDIHGLGDPGERRAKVAETLRRVGLNAEDAGRYPHEFSGGQRQRVAIARALPLEPDLVVCDEPVSALDVSIRAQVLNLLADLQQEFGLTYLFISHDLSVIGHLCDRVAVMYLGRIVEQAPRGAFFAQPLHPYAQALLTAVPVPDPTAERHAASLTGDLPSPLNPPSGCPFHPRCPRAMDVCSRKEPEFREIEPGRHAACWLY
jgi:oligopeptide/dipeptide ABC transporter ATP-binding protein